MSKYTVIEPLNHNNKYYEAGSEIELYEEEANKLIASHIINTAAILTFDVNHPAYNPDWTNGQLAGWGNAKYPDLKLSKSMKKADLIAALEAANNEGE